MKMRIIDLVAVFMLAGIILTNVRIPVGTAASQTDINNAIEKGLAYLNSTQASDGHWGDGWNPVASTAMAVLSFENAPNNHFGWNLTDPYHTTVQKGLDWLFAGANVQPIGVQPAGDPDSNGNGIGIYFSDGQPVYETPMALMAIVGTQAPTNVTTTGPANVVGRTYHDITVDIVDYLAWAQNEGPTGRGGWRYSPNYGDSDNSVSQWPVLGLMTAELWGITASAFVKSELLNYWATTDQNLDGTYDTNYYYGSFGYNTKDTFNSIAETGAGIMQLTYCGVPKTDPRIIAAQGYIVRDWLTNSGWRVNIGNFYAMYAVMKACRLATPTPIEFIANYTGAPTIEWYNGTGQYADQLVTNQGSDGHWDQWVAPEGVTTDLSTAWGVLILEFVPVRVEYTLTVHVVDVNTNSSVSGANVIAVGPQNRSGTTDGGTVVFNKTQAGNYVVSASKLGYTSASVNASLTKDTEITIRLTPLTRELKKDAMAELKDAKQLTHNKCTIEKIDKAIEEIKESLNPCLWVDDFHLDPKHGSKVFQEEKDAVGKLMEILNDKKESGALKNVIQAVIGKLLQVDQLLADTAIKDVKALGSTNCRVIHEIKEADEEFSEALKEITRRNYDQAVEEFKHAWMRAEHAMKKEFGDVDANGCVDGKDFAIVCKAFGRSSGQPGWNPTADLNGDNRVDVQDLSIVSRNFGDDYD
jgi:hypothetical protein